MDAYVSEADTAEGGGADMLEDITAALRWSRRRAEAGVWGLSPLHSPPPLLLVL